MGGAQHGHRGRRMAPPPGGPRGPHLVLRLRPAVGRAPHPPGRGRRRSGRDRVALDPRRPGQRPARPAGPDLLRRLGPGGHRHLGHRPPPAVGPTGGHLTALDAAAQRLRRPGPREQHRLLAPRRGGPRRPSGPGGPAAGRDRVPGGRGPRRGGHAGHGGCRRGLPAVVGGRRPGALVDEGDAPAGLSPPCSAAARPASGSRPGPRCAGARGGRRSRPRPCCPRPAR